jgi:hypothetical protein
MVIYIHILEEQSKVKSLLLTNSFVMNLYICCVEFSLLGFLTSGPHQ